MKTQYFAILLSLLGLVLPAGADSFVLKDGTSLEGSILKEDATSYLLEVYITKTIKDEKRVAKADVKRIKREKKDLIAFEAVEKLVPTPDFLDAAAYAARIKVVEQFLKKYPATLKKRDAGQILATLQQEARAVDAGGVKSGGKIIVAADYLADAYDIDASAEAARIKQMVGSGQLLGALREFNRFGADYKNSNAYREMVPLAKKVIRTYAAEAKRLQSTLDSRMKRREAGLGQMSSADRRATEAALREERAVVESRLAAEKAKNLGWVTIHPDVKETLDDTVSFANAEVSRLDGYLSSPAVDGGKLYRDTMGMIHSDGDPSEINNSISTARGAGIGEKYIEMLEVAAKSAESAE